MLGQEESGDLVADLVHVDRNDMMSQFAKVDIIEEVVEFRDVNEEYVGPFLSDDPVSTWWDSSPSFPGTADLVKMLDELIVSEDFTRNDVSDFVHHSLLRLNHLPLMTACFWVYIPILNFYDGLYAQLAPFGYEESI